MKGHFYKPNCKCVDSKGKSKKTKKCSCGATWSYILDIGTDPKFGRRKQKKKGGFKNKGDAATAAAGIIHELNVGTYIKESNITFEAFAEEWLTMYESTGKVKTSTIRVRKHEIKRLLDYFGKLKLKEVSRTIYQDALIELKKRGFADNTLDGAHRTGRMIFKKAIELELIKKDPTEYATIPKVQKTVEEIEKQEEVIKYLEKEELSKFLRMAKDQGLTQDYIIFLTLAYTGLRAGELCGLKWKDIDFKQHTLTISRTYYNPTNNTKEYQLLTPKTTSAKRTIDLAPILIQELENHRAFQNKIKIRYRDIYHNHDFVIAKTEKNKGFPETLKTIENRMKRLLKLAELSQNHTPHTMRHSHVSLLAEAGVSLPEIMQRLGHKDEKTTKHVYLHQTKSMKKEASQKFAQLMENL